MLADARAEAMSRMVDDAKRLNADAIVNVRFTTSQTMAGAAELLAYGTAVATVISVGVGAFLTLRYFISGVSKLTVSMKTLRFAPELMRDIAPVGFSGMAMQLMTVIQQVILFVPIVIILPFLMGLNGVWIAVPISDALIVLISSILVIRELRCLGISKAGSTERQQA